LISPEQPARQREPLEQRTGAEAIFNHLVVIAASLGADLLNPADDLSVAAAHACADEILEPNKPPAAIRCSRSEPHKALRRTRDTPHDMPDEPLLQAEQPAVAHGIDVELNVDADIPEQRQREIGGAQRNRQQSYGEHP